MLERCAVPSVCLFGNSDWAGLLPVARAARTKTPGAGDDAHVRFADGTDVFTLRTRARDAVTNEPLATVDVLSCSLVPVCAHRKKDWERCDTATPKGATDQRPGLAPDDARGFVSAPDEEHGVARGAVDLSEEGARLRSIQSALAAILHRFRGAENSVPPLWVTHAPPFGTVGDTCASGASVGSAAVRDAIEAWSPRLTLHGHIHERGDARRAVLRARALASRRRPRWCAPSGTTSRAKTRTAWCSARPTRSGACAACGSCDTLNSNRSTLNPSARE